MKEKEVKDKVFTNKYWLIICLSIALIIALFYSRIEIKISKKRLVSFYKVDKKTFNKWVEYFCPNVFSDMFVYNSRRKLTFVEARQIILQLGFPYNFPVMTKKQIIKKAEGSYRSLRASVQVYPDRFGISLDVFSKLNKFPPNISRKILEQYD